MITAVQAALDAYSKLRDSSMDYGSRSDAMQAALNAAFPIMLREAAEILGPIAGYELNRIADNYGKP